MAIVENPKSELVNKLTGVHLFGFDAAPCSQRVSFALAEKGLLRGRSVKWASENASSLIAKPDTYTFRQVSLIKHENMTEAFAQIQPNMVVPALVHDGKLCIESMDIIDYLDATWPENSLRPHDAERATLCDELVDQGKALHVSIRHVSFHWGLGKIGKTDAKTQQSAARIQSADSPEQLAEFYAKFNDDAIARDTFIDHLRRLETAYGAQEKRLLSDGRAFLTGDSFSMADIIWSIKVLRLIECGYPLKKNFPVLAEWYARVSARPGFKDGVANKNRFFHYAFRAKAGIENFVGQGILRDSRLVAG